MDTYLVTDYERPLALSGSLDNRVRKWIIAAGLCVDAKDEDGNLIYEGTGKRKKVNKRAPRSQHWVRKGVGALMAKSGASESEIIASFGWMETKTATIYTKKIPASGAVLRPLPRGWRKLPPWRKVDHGLRILVRTRTKTTVT